ncbi:hypothetical protein GCM10010174_10990 [Kutzneria viridogrisea]|uniref:ABC-2 family transporter n=1 Tax=Kutzneria viridogrisea TaxID=47990 RepID=A0ABR6BI37_9PSEU|nr:hypothetical protein [Kutzneria viridogrisea]
MLWLTWRQHRVAVIGTALGFLALSIYLLNCSGQVGEVVDSCAQHDCQAGPGFALTELLATLRSVLWVIAPGLAALIGVFWGAPLVAREFEQRTHQFAWTQDRSATRWLGAKTAWLGGAAVLLTGLTGLAAQPLLHRLDQVDAGGSGLHPAPTAWAQMLVALAVFGFALGVAAGALVRRTLPAMAITAVGFLGAYAATMRLRLSWLPPERHLFSPATAAPDLAVLPRGSEVVETGYLDAAGTPKRLTEVCFYSAAPEDCLPQHGIPHSYVDYQPPDRVLLVELVGAGVLLVLAAGLFALAWYLVRRSVQVG